MDGAKNEMIKILPRLEGNPWAKEIMDGWQKTVLFKLEGEDKPFYLVIKGDEIIVKDEEIQNPDIVVEGKGEALAKVIRRERDITHPIAEGDIFVSNGKLSQLIILDRILATAKRKR